MELENAFPLPQPDPGVCRDEYLKRLLELYEVKDGTLEELSLQSTNRDHNASSKSSKRRSEYSRSRSSAINIKKIIRDRYSPILDAVGFVAVLYVLADVRNAMKIVRDMWSTTATVDKSLAMFSWSVQDHLARFGLRNHSYLDTVERSLKGQMDCFKFRMDIKEIIRLVELIYDDFNLSRSICENSMVAIRDAEVDVAELVMTTRKEADLQVMQLKKIMYDTPRSADPGGHRRKEDNAKLIYMNFVVPIEARYRINWAQATQEQVMLKDELSIKELEDAIADLNQRTREYNDLRSLCEIAFNMEVSDYMMRIEEKEEAYEKDMEAFDNDIKVTRKKVAKAVDELAFYKAQVPIFHEKIAQVQALLGKVDEDKNVPEPEPELPPKKPKKRQSKKKKF